MLDGKEKRKKKKERGKKEQQNRNFAFDFLDCEEKSGAIFYIRIAKDFHL